MPFGKVEIKERMSKYGTVYFPEDIKNKTDDLIGIEKNKEIMEDFFGALKKYKQFSEKLLKVRMTPSITMLLYGPPGTGKTSLTLAMAKKYEIPVCVVDADRLVSPLLGDTLKNMRNVVELAAEIAKENKLFLIFFDELDAIASERSNAHEVGEIKRGVISFLQIIDKVDYEGIPLAIFGATNHQSQLDSAVWRRFTYHIYFDFPDYTIRKGILMKFMSRLEEATIQIDKTIYSSLENEEKLLNDAYKEYNNQAATKINMIDFEDVWAEKNRSKQTGILTLTRGYTGADLERAIRVSLFKVIQKERLEYSDLINSLQFVGGTKQHVEQQQLLSGNAESTEKSTQQKNDDKTISTGVKKTTEKKKPIEV
jgi:SpoVK/Ycf46/Vps4 family AAA+-type ATPase